MNPSTNHPAIEQASPLVRFASRASLGVLALCLTLAACGGQTGVVSDQASRQVTESASSVSVGDAVDGVDAPLASGSEDDTVATGDESEEQGEAPQLSDLASEVIPLPSALPEVALIGVGDPVGDQPRVINLPSLGVSSAPIVPVGLEPNGELEVPEADTVGWYEFGVGVDGGRGSTVLAAHIAYNGQDGVFRDLVDLELGEIITIERDGEPVEYVIESVADYDKWELPIDDFFSESGQERVVLITCGGAFNPELASYEDNTVAIAVPV